MTGDAQKFLEKMVDAMADALYVKDVRHKWLFLNKQAYELLQLSPEDVQDKNEFDFFPRKTATAIHDNDRLVFETQAPALVELPIQLKGQAYYMTFHSAFFTVADEKYIVCIVQNTTQRKTAENRLVKEKQRFNLLADYADVGVVTCDTDGKIQFVNQRTMDYLGRPQKELYQSSVLNVFNVPEELQSFLQNQRRKPESKIVELFDTYVKHSSGVLLPVQVRVSPVFNNGKFREIILILKEKTNVR